MRMPFVVTNVEVIKGSSVIFMYSTLDVEPMVSETTHNDSPKEK